MAAMHMRKIVLLKGKKEKILKIKTHQKIGAIIEDIVNLHNNFVKNQNQKEMIIEKYLQFLRF